MELTNAPSLVSIGLIAYNRENTIGEAIRSLQLQSYKNIQLIISDDASVDQTFKICQTHANKDKRISFIRQKKNLGLASNSNFVLSLARGKYFMWASDDDLWHKDFIKNLVKALEKNKKAVLAMSNFYLFKNSHKYHEEVKLKGTFSGLNLIVTYLKKRPLLVWGLFRTDVLKVCGGFHTDRRSFYGGSDMLTVFKVLLNGDLVMTPKTLFFKRDSGFAVNPYLALANLDFSRRVRYRIYRYLHYPLFFLFDLFYYLKYTLESNFSIIKKITILVHLLIAYFFLNFEVASKILKGVEVIWKSVLPRLVNPWSSKNQL